MTGSPIDDNTLARFQTHRQYYIVGIGLILTGEILSGAIEYGDHIHLHINKQPISYLVTDVQTIEYMTAETSETALILDLITGDEEINYLEKIAGKIIDITK